MSQNFPFHNYVHQIGTSNVNTRGPSPRLWSRFNALTFSPDGGNQGTFLYDDFLSWGGSVSSNVGTYSGGYKSFENNSCSLTQRAIGTYDGGAGVVRLLTDTTDNAEVNFQSGYSTGTLGAISDTAGDSFPMAFECRVMFSQVSNTYNFFCGLMEEGLAATDGMITDSGAMVDKDFIGFQVLEADGDAMNIVYNKASGSVQTVIAGAQALAASTWYKFGFLFDPSADTSKRITYYIDNVEQGTYTTGTQIAASTFPNAQGLALSAVLKNQTTVAKSWDLDWWAFGQAKLVAT